MGLDGGGRDAGIDVDVDAFSMAGWSHYFFACFQKQNNDWMVNQYILMKSNNNRYRKELTPYVFLSGK